jgi:hypothetical protein
MALSLASFFLFSDVITAPNAILDPIFRSTCVNPDTLATISTTGTFRYATWAVGYGSGRAALGEMTLGLNCATGTFSLVGTAAAATWAPTTDFNFTGGITVSAVAQNVTNLWLWQGTITGPATLGKSVLASVATL